jgi:4-aminobutyrate aminotransferase / (S)-3-amino-2-methylpropionate transaminase / 5-aminovalerate transaminase
MTVTNASSETISRYRDYVTTSFVTSIEPVVVAHAEGARIADTDGKEYVDCFAGIAVTNAGHRHPRIIAAAKEQLDRYVHAATNIYHVPVVGELAQRLAEITPSPLQKTFFGNSGAEGIETAMRLAKSATGKNEFISLTHSFHGRTAGTLSVTGNRARKTRGDPYLPGISFAPAPSGAWMVTCCASSHHS